MGGLGGVSVMEESRTTPKASRQMLYTALAAVGGIALGLAIGLLAGGSGSAPADSSTAVVATGGEEYVITPEAAEAAGYVPKPSYRVLAKEDADKLAKGMTSSEVQALFPDLPIVYSNYIHQPDAMIEGYSSVLAVIGYAPEGQISMGFRNGELDYWMWWESPNRSTFTQHPSNEIIQAIKEGEGEEWDW